MNKSLSQLGRQLLAAWKQLGLNQRISVALAFFVVLGVLTSLGVWSGRVDYALLYGKLDDAEAAKVVAYLDETKVPHKIGQGGGAIYVPRDKVHLARLQLAAKGVPRGDGVGFEVFDKPNFGISDFVQRANYLRAIQGELARTISQLDEIEAARVMIVLPENRLLVDNHKRATASVFVKVRGNAQLAASAINSVRFLVANSVEGLQPGQVIVVDNRGNVLSENSDADSLVGLTASQLSARRSLEQYLGRKAEGMLEAVLGPGQAVVRVSADINLDTLTRTEEKFDPDGQVLRTSVVNDESTDTTGISTGGGAPGVAANIGSETNGVAGSSGGNSRNKKKVTNTQYEINRVTSNMTQLAGGLKRVTAAVFVAARYEGSGAARKSVPRAPEELDKLRHIVQSALGLQSGDASRKDEITLEEMPFSEPMADVAQDIGKQEKRQFWFNQVQNFVYPGLALVVFAIFWRALKRTSPAPVTDGVVAEPLPAAGAPARGATPGVDVTEWQPRETEPAGAVSVDVFNKIVRENPDNVTQAIQSWLARGTPTQR